MQKTAAPINLFTTARRRINKILSRINSEKSSRELGKERERELRNWGSMIDRRHFLKHS